MTDTRTASVEVPDAPRVLVVDDDPRIREMVSDYLGEEGLRVSAVGDVPAARKAISEQHPDLVILDVRLPGEDGLTLAAELRRTSSLGLIMLSEKDEVVDRVAGLEVGADDYVSKPFHLRELLARVHSVLRRAADRSAATPATPVDSAAEGERFAFAGWLVDAGSRTARSPEGKLIELSAGEFDLLLAFLRNPKRVLTRDRLLDLARDRAAAPYDRSVDVQVGRLRRKIEASPRRPKLIKTMRGVGYMFAVDVQRL